jgi:hypothetical protein
MKINENESRDVFWFGHPYVYKCDKNNFQNWFVRGQSHIYIFFL